MKNTRVQKLIVLLLLFASVLGLTACGEIVAAMPVDPAAEVSAAEAPASVGELSAQSALSESGDASPLPAETQETAEAPVFTPEPTLTPTPIPEPTPEPAPIYTGPDLTEQPRIDDAFFADAAFLGNSLVRGLSMYGKLEYGDFYGATSVAVQNVGTTRNSTLHDGTQATMLDALCETQYGKIYILLGINEIGFEPDYFIELYSRLLDDLATREPAAEFYIMSLTPVTEEKSLDESVFTEERVLEYNAALHEMATERQCWYVDLVEALAGEDGYLPAEISTDGIHLTKESYPLWSDYLRTHYAPQE